MFVRSQASLRALAQKRLQMCGLVARQSLANQSKILQIKLRNIEEKKAKRRAVLGQKENMASYSMRKAAWAQETQSRETASLYQSRRKKIAEIEHL
jgi:hypothetical protein